MTANRIYCSTDRWQSPVDLHTIPANIGTHTHVLEHVLLCNTFVLNSKKVREKV